MSAPLAPLLLRGDCLDELRRIPAESVHAVVTDPPYGLANTDPKHANEALARWASGDRAFVPEGRGFMGEAWDRFVPPPAAWDEVMRILVPGGHLLAFAGTRTFDLMGISIRLAGFEIRDSLAWLYGQGFPKSMDVSKAIERTRTEDVEPVRVVCRVIRAAMDARNLRSRDLVEHFDGCHPRLIDHWAARDTDSQPSLPTVVQWEILREVLSIADSEVDAEVVRLNDRKGTAGEAFLSREVTGRHVSGLGTGASGVGGQGEGKDRRDVATTEAAREWEGWGTALKPAFEPIVVARKPFAGTVAANVLEHGAGALNIDATRIEVGDSSYARNHSGDRGHAGTRGRDEVGDTGLRPGGGRASVVGRWPANVALDESQAAELDAQAPKTGAAAKASGPSRSGKSSSAARGMFAGTDDEAPFHADEGGASRFFYVPKAPKSERPAVDGVVHSTVKPLALMRWLIRLVTPPGGCVVDPFAGSGTTLEAAYLEGFESIGIEVTPKYWPLIEARIQRAIERSSHAEN